MNLRQMVIILITAAVLTGCLPCPEERLGEFTISNIDQVFFNERGRWSFLVGGGIRTVSIIWNGSERIVRVDIEKPEVFYTVECIGGSPLVTQLLIRLPKSYKIDGGGWDHGKFGQGKTSVVE